MKQFDFWANAKIAADRKGITEEQAMKDLRDIEQRSKSDWSFSLAVRNYLDTQKETTPGGPHGVDHPDPVYHTKE